MPVWSKIPELEQKIIDLIPLLKEKGIELELKKEIPYGTQIECADDSASGFVTLYYSKKKGFSAVDNSKNSATAELCSLFTEDKEEAAPISGNSWSEISELEEKLNGLLPRYSEKGITLSLKKEIPYGTQVSCQRDSASGSVTFYFSKKKGFSAVDNSKSELTAQVCRIFLGEQETAAAPVEDKGDFTWSPIPELEKKIASFVPAAAELGVLLSVKKEIPYGVQITCEGPEESGTITFYYSKKKGFSAVENTKSELIAQVSSLFTGKSRELPSFRPRIGSDEAGKGDFFGPLVTAAFYIETEEMEQEILALGIRDSKKLSDAKISQMARQIRAKWPDHCEIISPSVDKYNNLYDSIGNLNRLLGWMHGRILADLSKRHFSGTKIEAIVDKFADESHVTKSVAGLERLDISAITHGEDAELAIAAASVIARDRFVFLMKKMSETFGMDIPMGAGPQVKKAGREFISRYGRARLKEVAKIHFKTAKEL